MSIRGPAKGVAEINKHLQDELRRRNLFEVSAVEAAAWLEAAGLLKDSLDRPGRPLRELLRAGLIDRARQEHNRRWFIERADAVARRSINAAGPVVTRSSAAASTARSLPFEDLASSLEGFVPLRTLDPATVPAGSGVYVVFAPEDFEFLVLDGSSAGHFKDKDPTVDPELLLKRWISETRIIYIGKATSLRSRLRQFRDFGNGRPVGHWGGRYLWQLDASHRLLVAWRTVDDFAREESSMLAAFVTAFGRLPFANITGPQSLATPTAE